MKHTTALITALGLASLAALHGAEGSPLALWLFGFECCHPPAVVDAHPEIKARAQIKGKPHRPRLIFAGNARYCIRHAEGASITYELAEIPDPREPQLVSTRTLAVSPFPEDQGHALYFGGYDCNGVPSHNTAWIYRGELADK